MCMKTECILLICWGQSGSDHWEIGQVLSFLFFHQAPCILQMFNFLRAQYIGKKNILSSCRIKTILSRIEQKITEMLTWTQF